MSVEAIAAVSATEIPLGGIEGLASPSVTQADWAWQQVLNVNDQLIKADAMTQAVATGEAESLHEVMISIEEARLSFLLLTQIRNRVLEATQELLRMQI